MTLSIGSGRRCADITFRYPYPLPAIRIRMFVKNDIRILSVSVRQFFTKAVFPLNARTMHTQRT